GRPRPAGERAHVRVRGGSGCPASRSPGWARVRMPGAEAGGRGPGPVGLGTPRDGTGGGARRPDSGVRQRAGAVARATGPALLAARRGGRASVWRVLRRVVEVRGRWGWVLLGTALVVGPAVTATSLVGELAPWPVLPALFLCLVFLLPAAAEELGWAHLTDL